MTAPDTANSAASRARRTITGMLSTSRRVKVAAAAALVAAVGAGLVPLALHGDDHAPTTPAKPVSEYTVLAPADGTLRVKGVEVPQLAGACQGESCRYTTQDGHAQLPVITVDTKTRRIPVKAAQSSTFAVSAFNTAKPSAPVSLGYASGFLLVDSASPGTYQVSLSGDRGGIWQFTLKVAKPKA